jgi:predicted peptidase
MTESWTGRFVKIASLSVGLSILAPPLWALRPGEPEQEKPLTRGFHRLEFALGEDASLGCSLWMPPLQHEGEVPLVLALHYGGEVTPHLSMGFLQSLVVPGLKKLGAVIVAPDCPGDGWTDEASERAVLALLDYAVRNWPVDRRRIVVTGYSLGGIGTWFFAARHPEIFSAAVPMAGRPVIDAGLRVPVYAIHGRRDEVIDVEPARRAIDALRAEGVEAHLVIVKGTTHYETRRFAGPLKGAVEWLQNVWDTAPHPSR